MVPIDILVSHEKSRSTILLWDDFTMGKLGFACMKGGQRNIQGFVACFGHFQVLRAPPRATEVPYGQPSVP